MGARGPGPRPDALSAPAPPLGRRRLPRPVRRLGQGHVRVERGSGQALVDWGLQGLGRTGAGATREADRLPCAAKKVGGRKNVRLAWVVAPPEQRLRIPPGHQRGDGVYGHEPRDACPVGSPAGMTLFRHPLIACSPSLSPASKARITVSVVRFARRCPYSRAVKLYRMTVRSAMRSSVSLPASFTTSKARLWPRSKVSK